jgi:hypothetical protein
MTRKRCHRRAIIALPPRGMRERMKPETVTTLAIAHITNLDEISRGTASDQTLWDFCGAVFTWAKVSEMMQQGTEEMAQQLDLAAAVAERYKRTGRVGFSGVEYQAAKRGVQVMDALAEVVDIDTAKLAAAWSEERLNRMVARERLAVAA